MTGTQLRDLGLAQVANSHPEFITLARKVLDALIKLQGRATIDEVRDILATANIYPGSNHAWGAVPGPKKYVCVGQLKSSRPSNRARIVRVWAHSVPKLDIEPPQGEGRKEYYYPPRMGQGGNKYGVRY